MPDPLTDGQRADIRRLAADGLSQAEIARRINSTKGQVNRACQDGRIKTYGRDNGMSRRPGR